jgi:RNA polymerase sigma factor (sigma-70 family)
VAAEADADDIAQQVFIAAWKSRERFDPSRGPLGAWIMGIARFKIVDAQRAAGRRRDDVVLELVPSGGGSAGTEHVDHLAERLLLADALAQLPPERVWCWSRRSSPTSPIPRSPKRSICPWAR